MATLLLFSDLHRDQDACTSLIQRAHDADVLLGAGDFCTMRRGLDEVIDALSVIETPTILVPGNAESADELRAACASWSAAHVLHGETCTVEGLDVAGIGGGIPITPFGDWSYDLSESEAEELMADLSLPGTPGGVLVSHSPPKGVVDRDSSGTSLGSTAIRAAIDRLKPNLVVCGHIHGSWEQRDTIGDTEVINAGPNGVWVEL